MYGIRHDTHSVCICSILLSHTLSMLCPPPIWSYFLHGEPFFCGWVLSWRWQPTAQEQVWEGCMKDSREDYTGTDTNLLTHIWSAFTQQHLVLLGAMLSKECLAETYEGKFDTYCSNALFIYSMYIMRERCSRITSGDLTKKEKLSHILWHAWTKIQTSWQYRDFCHT